MSVLLHLRHACRALAVFPGIVHRKLVYARRWYASRLRRRVTLCDVLAQHLQQQRANFWIREAQLTALDTANTLPFPERKPFGMVFAVFRPRDHAVEGVAVVGRPVGELAAPFLRHVRVTVAVQPAKNCKARGRLGGIATAVDVTVTEYGTPRQIQRRQCQLFRPWYIRVRVVPEPDAHNVLKEMANCVDRAMRTTTVQHDIATKRANNPSFVFKADQTFFFCQRRIANMEYGSIPTSHHAIPIGTRRHSPTLANTRIEPRIQFLSRRAFPRFRLGRQNN